MIGKYKSLIYKALILLIAPCFILATAGSVFANQLVSGYGVYAFIGLLIFVICFRYVYSFLMRKIESKYGQK